MRAAIASGLWIAAVLAVAGCAHEQAASGNAPVPVSAIDPELASYIDRIRAVDDHTHANSVAMGDIDYDALPLEVTLPFEFPARLRTKSPAWVAAYHTVYGESLPPGESDLKALAVYMVREFRARHETFPEWVLDRIGTEVMLANRVAMGPGLAPPRFRWVSYVDALLFPLSTRSEGAATPDRQKLFPYEEKLLKRYLADLKLAALPATLDAYLSTVVTPTLEHQHENGCVALKFEAAYLRSLAFEDPPRETASRVYARYVRGGEPTHADYKALQDFLFREIAREAGRLEMAVHLHSFEGFGAFYRVAESDPLLLEPVLNDPTLRRTNFVIVHGGGAEAPHAGMLLAKPNAYLDISALVLVDSPETLARVLRPWLEQYPEKVLFGTDAAAYGPGIGWDVAAALGTTTARRALAITLSDLMREGELTRERAEQIASMVMRENAARLYRLALP